MVAYAISPKRYLERLDKVAPIGNPEVKEGFINVVLKINILVKQEKFHSNL
jgi:hypothetical protein